MVTQPLPGRVERTAERLSGGLDAVLGDAYRKPPGASVNPYRDGLVIGSYDIAERCGRRAARPADDYEERVLTARRRVGLLLLRDLWDSAPADRTRPWRADPADLVLAAKRVFSYGDRWPDRLWGWSQSLEPAGRAALVAASITWADGAVRSVGSARDITWSDPRSSLRRDVPGRSVRLAAAVDATRRVGDDDRLLIVSPVLDPSARRLMAAHAALVGSFEQRRHPVARVSVASTNSGDIEHFVVDSELVDLAVDRVVEHAALRLRPDDAAPRPSSACRHCHVLDSCEEGRIHLGLPGPLSGPALTDSVGTQPAGETQEPT